MSQLRARPTNARLFMLSGLDNEVRKDLSKKITQLGGKYLEIQAFKAVCTHLICGKLSRSEKFLGACATGKWVLHPRYILDSAAAGCWLDEEQYEWCDDSIARIEQPDQELAFAPRRWRFLLGGAEKAFSGWKVAVIAGAKRLAIMRRLLMCGGAQMFNLKLPVKRPEKIVNSIGYIFVCEQYLGAVSNLMEYGVLCVKPDFIGDYLIKDPPPDPMDYLAQVSLPGTPGMGPGSNQSQLNTEEDGQLNLSQTMSFSQNFLSSTQVPGSSQNQLTMGEDGQFNLSQTMSFSQDFLSSTQAPGSSQSQVTPVEDGQFSLSQATSSSQDAPSSTQVSQTASNPSTSLKAKIDTLPYTPEIGYSHLYSSSKSAMEQSEPAQDISGQDHTLASPSTHAHTNVKEVSIESPTEVRDKIKSSPGVGRETVIDLTQDDDSDVETIIIKVPAKKSAKTLANISQIQGSNGKGISEGALAVIRSMSPITKFFKPITSDDNNKTKEMTSKRRLESPECVSAKKIRQDSTHSSENKAEPASSCSQRREEAHDLGPRNVSEQGDNISTHAEMCTSTVKKNNEEMQEEVSEARFPCTNVQIKKEPTSPRSKENKTPPKDNLTKLLSSLVKTVKSHHENAAKKQKERNTQKSPVRNIVGMQISPSHSSKSQGENDVGSVMDQQEDSVCTSERPKEGSVSWKNSANGALSQPSTRKKRKRPSYSALQCAIREMKRQKIPHFGWRHSSCELDSCEEKECHSEGELLPETLTNIIHTTLDDKFTIAALQELRMRVSTRYHPPSSTLRTIMTTVLMTTQSELEANWAYNVLMDVLHLHPPVTMAMQGLYLQAMAEVGQEARVGDEWNLLKGCFSRILTEAENSYGCRLLLKFIMAVLRRNFHHHVQCGQGTSVGARHMLLRILWSPSYHVGLNTRCRELLDIMCELIRFGQSRPESEKSLFDLLQDGASLVAMAAECCRISEGGSIVSFKCLNSDTTALFVAEVAKRLSDIHNWPLVQHVLSSFQLPWLCVGVCKQILTSFDDYLLSDEPTTEKNSVTMTTIVSRYFFLLPRLQDVSTSARVNSPSIRRSPKRGLSENTDVNKANISRQKEAVHKRNKKGETALHTACIKNNLGKVKALLAVPGIDVNVKDNAGWTPLHEACNHGNVECVLELLKYVPAKTVDTYFSKDVEKCRKADLYAVDSQGITPLHDAVINGHTEVCEVLLQHGGPNLLQPVTCMGYTPLDFVETDEMRSLLSSFLPTQRTPSESQESLVESQDSVMSSHNIRTEMPCEKLYEHVMFKEGAKVFADTKALIFYIRTVTMVVKSYISATNAARVQDFVTNYRKLLNSRLLPNGCNNSNRKLCASEKAQRTAVTTTADEEKMEEEAVDERSELVNNHIGLKCASDILSENDDEDEDGDNSDEKEAVKLIRRDLGVLKDFNKYVSWFKSHVRRICLPKELSVIDSALLDLLVLADDFDVK